MDTSVGVRTGSVGASDASTFEDEKNNDTAVAISSEKIRSASYLGQLKSEDHFQPRRIKTRLEYRRKDETDADADTEESDGELWRLNHPCAAVEQYSDRQMDDFIHGALGWSEIKDGDSEIRAAVKLLMASDGRFQQVLANVYKKDLANRNPAINLGGQFSEVEVGGFSSDVWKAISTILNRGDDALQSTATRINQKRVLKIPGALLPPVTTSARIILDLRRMPHAAHRSQVFLFSRQGVDYRANVIHPVAGNQQHVRLFKLIAHGRRLQLLDHDMPSKGDKSTVSFNHVPDLEWIGDECKYGEIKLSTDASWEDIEKQSAARELDETQMAMCAGRIHDAVTKVMTRSQWNHDVPPCLKEIEVLRNFLEGKKISKSVQTGFSILFLGLLHDAVWCGQSGSSYERDRSRAQEDGDNNRIAPANVICGLVRLCMTESMVAHFDDKQRSSWIRNLNHVLVMAKLIDSSFPVHAVDEIICLLENKGGKRRGDRVDHICVMWGGISNLDSNSTMAPLREQGCIPRLLFTPDWDDLAGDVLERLRTLDLTEWRGAPGDTDPPHVELANLLDVDRPWWLKNCLLPGRARQDAVQGGRIWESADDLMRIDPRFLKVFRNYHAGVPRIYLHEVPASRRSTEKIFDADEIEKFPTDTWKKIIEVGEACPDTAVAGNSWGRIVIPGNFLPGISTKMNIDLMVPPMKGDGQVTVLHSTNLRLAGDRSHRYSGISINLDLISGGGQIARAYHHRKIKCNFEERNSEANLSTIGLLNMKWLPDEWKGKPIRFSPQLDFSQSMATYDEIVSKVGTGVDVDEESAGLIIALIHCTLAKTRSDLATNQAPFLNNGKNTKGYGGMKMLYQKLRATTFSTDAREGLALGLLGELCDAAGASSCATGGRVNSVPGDLICSVARFCMLSPVLQSFNDRQRTAWIQMLYDVMAVARINKIEASRNSLHLRAFDEINLILTDLTGLKPEDDACRRDLIDTLCVMWAGISTRVQADHPKKIFCLDAWKEIRERFFARFRELKLKDFKDRGRLEKHDPASEFPMPVLS
jgi:hypothetical protein